jgi:rod shape-determining protein MreD
MIRTIALSTLLLVFCSYVQSTWIEAIAVFGVIPDLSLVVLIWVSYNNGLVEGPVSGFLSGIAEDLISAAPLGFNAFVKVVVSTSAGLLHGVFFIDRIALPFVLGFLGTIVKALATAFLALIFSEKVHSYDFLRLALWIEAAYNGIAAPVLFLLLSALKRILVTEHTEHGRE